MKKMFDNCESSLSRENVTVAKCGHFVQTDYAVVAPWELSLLGVVSPKYHLAHAYQLHSWLMLAFLGANDEGNYFDSKKAE